MKKILLFVLGLMFIQVNSVAFSECPTPGQYQDKLWEFRERAKKINSPDYKKNVQQANSLLEEEKKYWDSSFNSCVMYFQTPRSSYDCKRLQTLSSTYFVLDDSNKKIREAKIKKFPKQVKDKCPMEYDGFLKMIDISNNMNNSKTYKK